MATAPEPAIALPIHVAAMHRGGLAQSGRIGMDLRTLVLVLTGYWCYVALSNVLWANSLQSTLEHHVFAPALPRLLQHLFLYPVLLGCVWSSLRTGWQPLWRSLPLQLLLCLGFAFLAWPALWLGDHVSGHSAQMGSEPLLPLPNHHWLHRCCGVTALEPGLGYSWTATSLTFVLTYGFGLALITGLLWYQRYRDAQLRFTALERSLASTRLAALRMQLSPHTLFNLLHTIRGQIAWDPVSAQAMVVQLGDVLRRLLAAGERDFSRLGDEFQFVQMYLELQRNRFSDRLQIEMTDITPIAALWIPSLILQPLAENAVAHGLAGHVGPVLIRVEANIVDRQLQVCITNTTANGAASGAQGIGLRNVSERLRLHFGDAAALETRAIAADTWQAQIRVPPVQDDRGEAQSPV
jgi:hypothetical protein